MRRPLHFIQHVQVIGHDARIKQRITEVRQRLRVIIDATQQDALIEQRNACDA
ncbi:hypothetical protein SDC9_194589 [bioreactor metagenome]|uniref:Uncharacterized protein n=1 Tax=bioreactor metagenome TaxID=1076179 RepID=A0A645I991_9ZZZZ